MDAVEEPSASLHTGESKPRTPAYASFAANAHNLVNVLGLIERGVNHFADELKTNIGPEVTTFCTEIAGLGRRDDREAIDQETEIGRRDAEPALSEPRRSAEEIAKRLSDIVVEPLEHFTSGLWTVRQWIPVMMVTTVEAYLKDVRIFEAKVNPAIMESSEQSVTYTDVRRARSIEELAEEMQSRWARNFVDDGGPDCWIDKLTRMGARVYDSQATRKMETLWGVRHVVVHSAGVATPDFVRRHPDFGATIGESISIRSARLREWINVIDHFVDVTDSYFVRRYGARPVSTT